MKNKVFIMKDHGQYISSIEPNKMTAGLSEPKIYNSVREAELDILKVYMNIEIIGFESKEKVEARMNALLKKRLNRILKPKSKIRSSK